MRDSGPRDIRDICGEEQLCQATRRNDLDRVQEIAGKADKVRVVGVYPGASGRSFAQPTLEASRDRRSTTLD